jgi:Leucine-rich repeat (LRR) protein
MSFILLFFAMTSVFQSRAKATEKIDFNVKSLKIQQPERKFILEQIGQFEKLEKLEIACIEDIRELPESIGRLTKLKELLVDNGNGCSMNIKLPESIGNLSELRVLSLNGAQDQSLHPQQPGLPNSIVKLKKLEILDLSRSNYTTIPDSIQFLVNLRELYFNFSNIQDVPSWLIKTNIKRIILDNNFSLACNFKRIEEIKKQYPKITFTFDFEYDYECPANTKTSEKI